MEKRAKNLTAHQRGCLKTARFMVVQLRFDGTSRRLTDSTREELLSQSLWLILQAQFKEGNIVYHAEPGVQFLFVQLIHRFGGKDQVYLELLREIVICKDQEKRAVLVRQFAITLKGTFFRRGPILYPEICEVLNARQVRGETDLTK